MKRLLISTVASFFIFSGNALAENYSSMSPSIESRFFVKIMNFDSAVSGAVKVAVIFNPNSNTSVNTKKKIVNALQNYDLEVISVPVGSIDQVKSYGVNAFYISKDLDESISKISYYARKHKIVTFSSDINYVEEGYASVASGLNATGKPRIIVNMKSLKREGHSFASQLLRLANIIQ